LCPELLILNIFAEIVISLCQFVWLDAACGPGAFSYLHKTIVA